MIKVRDVAARMLGESPGIFDEVAQIGLDMWYAARAWKEAVEDGMPSKARYAKQAVACGVAFFRSNIPEDKEAERAAVLKNREEYFANFKKAIQTGEKIDNLEKELASLESNIKKKSEKRAPLVARVQELKETEEGREKLTRLYRSRTDPQGLDSEDRKFAEEMLDDMSLFREIERLVMQRKAKVTELSANWTQLSQVDQALSRNPDQAYRDSTPEVDVQPLVPGEQYYRAIRRMAELMDELPQSREAKERLIRILEEKRKK